MRHLNQLVAYIYKLLYGHAGNLAVSLLACVCFE